MKTEDWLIVGAIAVGAYVVYKGLVSPAVNWTRPGSGIEAARAAGFVVTESTIPSDAGKGVVFIQDPRKGLSYRTTDEELRTQTNWAQKTLMTLDKIVPGTWLTRWTLG